MSKGFAHRPEIGHDAGMGALVIRLALDQQFPDPRFRIGHIQQGPVLIAGDAAQDGFRTGGQGHDHALGQQAIHHAGLDGQASAAGHHTALTRMTRFDEATLFIAEGGLAPLLEKAGNRHPDPFFDGPVDIDETRCERIGRPAPEGGFSRTHEADQVQVRSRGGRPVTGSCGGGGHLPVHEARGSTRGQSHIHRLRLAPALPRGQRWAAMTVRLPLASLSDPRLDEALAATWSTLADRFAAVPEGKRLWPVLAAFLKRSGKCVRPRLMLGAWEAWSGKPLPDAAFPAAAALEAFHAFLLIHDDVIDGSPQRRNGPALHKAIEKELGCRPRRAEHLAIVVGDVLFGFAGERLLGIGEACPADRVNAAARHFFAVSADTGLGEAAELLLQEARLETVPADAIEAVYVLKTARYTFESPVRLGLMLAGADDARVAEPVAQFGRLTGLAFQAENDLHEWRLGDEQAADLAYDLQCGVKTLILKEAETALTTGSRERLRNLLAETDADALTASLTEIRALIQKSGAIEQLERRMAGWLDEGATTLLSVAPTDGCRSGLTGLSALIRSRLHHSEAAAAKQPS